MRKLILISLFLCFLVKTASASECTDYLKEIYSTNQEHPVKIISKTEYSDKYEQKIGNYNISSITYGTGWIKCFGRKKSRITYLTLYDADCKPVWGYIIPR